MKLKMSKPIKFWKITASNKDLILTQSLTIQQVNQRLIVCLIAILQDTAIKLYFQDVIQAYIQSKSDQNRDIYIFPTRKLAILLRTAFEYILKVVKS